MKKELIACMFILLAFSCTKEQPKTDNQGQDIPISEFQVLKKQVEELKAIVDSMNSGNQEQSVSQSEFDALKQENEALKSQVELLTSGFFEVDGLRFDRNGSLISLQMLESESVQDLGNNRTLTTERTLDAQGRLIETMSRYGGYSSLNTPPYYWRRTIYEYNGKICRTTMQTYKYGLPAGVPYEEEITETTYW